MLKKTASLFGLSGLSGLSCRGGVVRSL